MIKQLAVPQIYQCNNSDKNAQSGLLQDEKLI